MAAVLRAPLERGRAEPRGGRGARGIALELLAARVAARSAGHGGRRLRSPSHPASSRSRGSPSRSRGAVGCAAPARRRAAWTTCRRRRRILGADVALVVMPHVDPLRPTSHDPGAGGRRRSRRRSALLRGRQPERRRPAAATSPTWGPMRSSATRIAGCWARRALAAGLAVARPWAMALPAACGGDRPVRARHRCWPLARSVGWLLMYVELPWVVERTGRLARRSARSLAAIDGVELRRRRAAHAGAARLPDRRLGCRAGRRRALAQRLRHPRRGYPTATSLRVSVGAWNREDGAGPLRGARSRSWRRTRPRRCRAGRPLTVLRARRAGVDAADATVERPPSAPDVAPARPSRPEVAAALGARGPLAPGAQPAAARASGRCSPTSPSPPSAASSCCSSTGWPASGVLPGDLRRPWRPRLRRRW